LKKLIALGLLAGAMFTAAPSHATTCAGPVSTDCTYKDDQGKVQHCDVYVEAPAGLPVAGSSCGSLTA